MIGEDNFRCGIGIRKEVALEGRWFKDFSKSVNGSLSKNVSEENQIESNWNYPNKQQQRFRPQEMIRPSGRAKPSNYIRPIVSILNRKAT